MNLYVGIDPGLGGAIAVLTDEQYHVLDTPVSWVTVGKKQRRRYDVHRIWEVLQGLPVEGSAVAFAALEQGIAFPGQHCVATFSTGKGEGLWEGLLVARGFRLQVVPPNVWKATMLKGTSRDKSAARLVAQRLFPLADLAQRKDEGRAEALLLAQYAKQWNHF
jgi:crossover junction endodeoxyribonuclease RuvC